MPVPATRQKWAGFLHFRSKRRPGMGRSLSCRSGSNLRGPLSILEGFQSKKMGQTYQFRFLLNFEKAYSALQAREEDGKSGCASRKSARASVLPGRLEASLPGPLVENTWDFQIHVRGCRWAQSRSESGEREPDTLLIRGTLWKGGFESRKLFFPSG